MFLFIKIISIDLVLCISKPVSLNNLDCKTLQKYYGRELAFHIQCGFSSQQGVEFLKYPF